MTSKSNKKGEEALYLSQIPRWAFLVRAKAFNLPAWKVLHYSQALPSASQSVRCWHHLHPLPSPRQREEQGMHNRVRADASEMPGVADGTEGCSRGRNTDYSRIHAAIRRYLIPSSSVPLPCIFLTRVSSLRVGNLPALVNSLSNHIDCTWKALQEVEDRLGDHTECSCPINNEDGGKAFKGGQACIKREAMLKELPKSALGSQGEEEMETKVTWKAPSICTPKLFLISRRWQ